MFCLAVTKGKLSICSMKTTCSLIKKEEVPLLTKPSSTHFTEPESEAKSLLRFWIQFGVRWQLGWELTEF